MFDAAGKLPPGIYKGNIQWLGNYKECISTSLTPGVSDSGHGIRSHYCPVAFGEPSAVCISITYRFLFSLCFFTFFVIYFVVHVFSLLVD